MACSFPCQSQIYEPMVGICTLMYKEEGGQRFSPRVSVGGNWQVTNLGKK